MKTDKLSAFVDGELFGAEKQATARELEDSDALVTAALYCRIGEELRAESAKCDLSPEFSLRMAARLEAEPPLSVQAAVPPGPDQANSNMVAQDMEPAKQTGNADKPAHVLNHLAISGLVA